MNDFIDGWKIIGSIVLATGAIVFMATGAIYWFLVSVSMVCK